jgi:hypothetical protein
VTGEDSQSTTVVTILLPPLLAGEGWEGVTHGGKPAYPLPTSPCLQGEEP